ncbi:MAG: phosphatase PAP2 family protein [Candidatus Cloacimonetes bacterium]|nr:phosphatase PAP2 family protein [Candidatus Cloacimonadota bacterium]
MNKGKLTISDNHFVWIPLILILFLIALVYFTGSNRIIFFWINGLHKYTGDTIWSILTIFGDGLIMAMLLFPMIRRRPDIIWTVLIASILVTILVQIPKEVIHLYRPPKILSPEEFHLIGPKYRCRAFPSGHTATIFTLVGVLSLSISKNWKKIILISFAILVGISRVAVGVHWPLDVLGGAFIGWLAACLGIFIAKHSQWGYSFTAQIIFGVILLVISMYLLFVYNSGYIQAFWAQRVIAVVCLLVGSYEYIRVIRRI